MSVDKEDRVYPVPRSQPNGTPGAIEGPEADADADVGEHPDSGRPPKTTQLDTTPDEVAHKEAAQTADAEADRADRDRLRRLGEALTTQAQEATGRRLAPAFVVVVGIALLVFWSAAGLISGSETWLSGDEVVAGLIVGGVLVLGGGVLTLYATVLPVTAIAQAARSVVEQRAERNRQLAELDAFSEASGDPRPR